MTWLLVILHVLVVLFLVYLFLIAPNILSRKMAFRPLTDYDYAHRGLYDNDRGIPENSLTAFERAVNAGYGIELDVRETRDHQLVVHHDENLERSCGDIRRVCDVPLAELQQLKLFGTDSYIPTLTEVLGVVNAQVPLIVELKTDFHNPMLAQQTYDMLRRYPGVYCVESFDPSAIRWFRKHAPTVVRGQLAFMSELKGYSFSSKLKRLCLGYLLVDFIGRPDFIAYGYETDANISFRLVSSVFRPLLAAWTVRDADTSRALREEYDIQIFERFKPAR